jgi:hypothetical protein
VAGLRLKWAQHSNGSQTARIHTSWGVAWFFEIRNGVLAAWSEGRVVETAEAVTPSSSRLPRAWP